MSERERAVPPVSGSSRQRFLPSVVLSIALFLTACTDEGPSPALPLSPPSSSDAAAAPGALLATSTGNLTSQAAMELRMAELARRVAVALRDDDVRQALHSTLAQSEYPEQKVHFRSLAEFGPSEFRQSLGRSGPETVSALLDSIADLEFYMPVAEHREAWDGDASVIVVSYPNDDGSQPYAYDLNGVEVPVSADIPPDVPALVLTLAETDFSRQPLLPERADFALSPSGPNFDPVPDPIGGGQWFMTQAHVDDLHEGWGLGVPEMEVHTFLKQVTTEWTDEWCAGQDHPTSVYNWNMNGNDWYGEVWLVTENKIGETHVQFQMWENDAGPVGVGDDHCASSSGMPPNTTSSIDGALFDLGTRVLNIYANQPDSEWKWIAALAGLIRPTLNIVASPYNDDFVGLFESPTCWPLPDQGRPVFSIVEEDGDVAGYAHVDVNYGVQEPMCPPTPVLPEVSITSFSIDSYEFLMQVAVNDSTNSIRVDRQLDGGAWTFVENRNIAPGTTAGLYVTHNGTTGQRAGIRLTPHAGPGGTGDDGQAQYRWADVP